MTMKTSPTELAELLRTVRQLDDDELAEWAKESRQTSHDEDAPSARVVLLFIALARVAEAEQRRRENIIELAELDLDDSGGDVIDGDLDIDDLSAELLGHVIGEAERRREVDPDHDDDRNEDA
jgi:hypothetical protein